MEKDLHVSQGPVSSMPGSVHSFPKGSMCDTHPDRPAVRRIQGETDSFGCEFYLECEECASVKPEPYKGTCDWCKEGPFHLVAARDYEEGSAGPIYWVCVPCKSRHFERLAQEMGDYD